MPILIDSVGLEFEVEDFPVQIRERELAENFTSTHDASCERDAKQLSCGLILPRNSPDMFATRNIVLGGELVSNIIDTTDDSYYRIIKNLTDYVIQNGESDQSFRAGIHVHICFSSPNLVMLKNTIRLWKHLEDLFYLLGGMGYEFRGVKNDSTYCRPLTKNGPIIVPTRGGVGKSVNLNHLLESKSISQFWERWGDLPVQGRERYFPVRYHGFNLSPAYNRGTIEFRVFNKTLNPLYIISVIEICKKFAEICLRFDASDFSATNLMQENSVFDRRNKDEIANTFLHFSELCKMKELVISEAMRIIERTPPVVLQEKIIYSHLRNIRTHWDESSYEPELVSKYIVEKPNFEDIHVLRGER